MLVKRLPTRAVDIVGDIHGEIEPLSALLEQLGYSETGDHPDGRTLVFVGDLVDRGPDSVAVVRLVRELVGNGAECILGNHELNILRGDHKPDNDWFFTGLGEPTQDEIRDFLSSLPLALENEDLRVVHACWDSDSIETTRAFRGKAIDFFKEAERKVITDPSAADLKAAAAREKMLRPKESSHPKPNMLHQFAEWELRQQLGNPVKVLTSGKERKARQPNWINGKWRYTERVKWWDDYHDQEIVVVGHYWRSRQKDHQFVEGPDLFSGTDPAEALGPSKQVMCIDYSIGGRSNERLEPSASRPYKTALASYRLHEDRPPELIFSRL